MKKLLFLLHILCSFHLFAQERFVTVLTLQQAKEQGLKNRYDIKANAYHISVARNNTRAAVNEWLPDINLHGNLRYNTQLQATMIPAGFAGPDPKLLAFGAKNVSIFDLSLDQAIFKPVNNTNIKIARNDEEIQKEKNRQYEIDIKTQIAQAYLDVQLKQLQLKIARDDEQRYHDYLSVADATYKAGSLLENELLKAKLDEANAKATTAIAAQQLALAMKNLQYQMNVPETTTLVLADSLEAGEGQMIPGREMDRTEIKQLQLTQQSNRLQSEKTRKSSLPTISLFADYSKQFLSDQFDYGQSKWWTPFSYLGLKLDFSLSALYKNGTSKKENEFHSQQTDLLLQQKIADVHYEIEHAASELDNARENMESAKRNYRLSQNIYSTQKQQYKFGVLRYNNLLDTEKSLSGTEQSYIQSIFDYMVASINWQRAEGTL